MADAVEVRLARLEGSYEQINERLGTIEGRLDSLETGLAGVRRDLSGLQSEMYRGFDKLRQEMRTQFYWLLGVIIVAFLVPLVLGVVF
jgi:hypothetical protein